MLQTGGTLCPCGERRRLNHTAAVHQPDLRPPTPNLQLPTTRQVCGYLRGYRRVFWQGSTDHRGTPERPGRTVTLVEDAEGVTWGAAFRLAGSTEQQREALRYLEWREKQAGAAGAGGKGREGEGGARAEQAGSCMEARGGEGSR